MFRLLYCYGLRYKEARTLAWENVHLDQGYLDIIQSKGPKSRRISCLFPDRMAFFQTEMTIRTVPAGWNGISCGSGMPLFQRRKNSDVSIRAYDFRHHFVHSNMNRRQQGKDVNAMLPYLMRYMRYSDVRNTLDCFHLVPDIYGGILDRSEHPEGLIPEVDDGREACMDITPVFVSSTNGTWSVCHAGWGINGAKDW